MGIRANGIPIDGKHEGDVTYLCDSIADELDIKTKNCSKYFSKVNIEAYHCLD